MKAHIKDLLHKLTGYYQRYGRRPESLYDLLLSLMMWELVSVREEAKGNGLKNTDPGMAYQNVMRRSVTPKAIATALRGCEKQYSALLKGLMLTDKENLDNLPDELWRFTSDTWIYFRNRHGDKQVLIDVADYLETQVADPRSEAGHLTPKAVVNAMVQYLVVEDGTSVYDPYPRTGNMLAAVAEKINSARIKGMLPAERLTQKIMLLRFLLLGKAEELLIDCVNNETKMDRAQEFDYIISNPPFGTRNTADPALPGVITGNWLRMAQGSNRLDVGFICHILSSLSKKGKAAVIVPVIYLSSHNTVVEALVKEIVDMNLLDMVVKLPGDLFANTKIASAILFFSKSRKDNQPVYFMDAAVDQKGKQFFDAESKLGEWIDQIKTNTADEDIWSTSVSIIKQNQYLLQPEQYKQVRELKEELKTAQQLWEACEELEQQLIQSRQVIKQFINQQ
ncbi:N-6 DNA methylase [Ferruginibacter sp.]